MTARGVRRNSRTNRTLGANFSAARVSAGFGTVRRVTDFHVVTTRRPANRLWAEITGVEFAAVTTVVAP